MDEVAEQGFAAHWKYKEGDNTNEDEIAEDEGELNDWLRTIKEILDDPQPDAMDFLDAIKLNLFASEIFVFTPKGEIMTMPAGCTALDFAFQIHTFLGSHCIGAKVNHKLVPLSHKLQSGDQVEVLTSKAQHVQPAWINFVSTAKAKAKIHAILRREARETQKKGQDTLQAFLDKNEIQLNTSVLDKLCDLHEIQNHENLLQAIGQRNIILGEKDIDHLRGKKNSSGWKKFVPFINSQKKNEKTVKAQRSLLTVGKDFNKKIPCYITEETIQMYIFPQCCHPIPGDDILGYIDNKNHVEIHKRNCPVASRLKSSFGNRILDAKWVMHNQILFDATIQIRGIDRKGILHDLADIISDKLDTSIHRIIVTSDDGIFEGKIELRVHDRNEMPTIIQQLKDIEGLQEVQQIL
jgi:GTP pyrophosphokinase